MKQDIQNTLFNMKPSIIRFFLTVTLITVLVGCNLNSKAEKQNLKNELLDKEVELSNYDNKEVTKTVLKDDYSDIRDMNFLDIDCNAKKISLERILIPLKDNETYSIRKGKELLVAKDETDKIIFKFKEIDGYSSLFIEKDSIKFIDINNDGKNELLIHLYPNESPQTLFIYTLNDNCKFKFVKELITEKFEIIDGEIKIVKTVGAGIITDFYFVEKVGINKFHKIDFYKLSDSKLISTNDLHQDLINEKINNYKKAITELNKIIEIDGEDIEITELIKVLKQTIDNY